MAWLKRAEGQGGLLCLLMRHRPVEKQVWNDGFYFSRCSRCGCEILRRGARWRPVPAGYRVVWAPPPENYPDWNGVAARLAGEQAQAERAPEAQPTQPAAG